MPRIPAALADGRPASASFRRVRCGTSTPQAPPAPAVLARWQQVEPDACHCGTSAHGSASTPAQLEASRQSGEAAMQLQGAKRWSAAAATQRPGDTAGLPTSTGGLMRTVAAVATAQLGCLAAAATAMASEAAAAAASSSSGDAAADEAAAKVAEALAAGTYVPSNLGTPGWEIWVGFIAGVIPFAIGSWEFAKRIIIQRRCEVCGGRGLVQSSREGSKYLRKCPQCGGFFPWVSWKLFLTSTAAPGNGGPLQVPKGQDGLFYNVEKTPTKPGEPQKASAPTTHTHEQDRELSTVGTAGASSPASTGSHGKSVVPEATSQQAKPVDAARQ